MKLGIVVNVMDSDEAGATTYRLAADAISLGHEVWIVSTGNMSYDPDDSIGAFARTVPPGKYTSAKFLDVLRGDKAINEWITVDDLDVLVAAQQSVCPTCLGPIRGNSLWPVSDATRRDRVERS